MVFVGPKTSVQQPFSHTLLIVVPALLGVIFCLANASGAELLCFTSGCSLYSGYSVFGVSVDVIGSVAFLSILIVALLARRQTAWRFPLYLLLLLGLSIDVLFLIWQILFWPCFSCLFVALLLLFCLLGALFIYPGFRTTLVYVVFLLWFSAFMPVVVDAGKEMLLRPWVAFGPADAPISVYFSPTCPSCQTSVVELLNMERLQGQVAFIPVSKSNEDLQRLAAMMQVGGEAGIRQLFDQGDVKDQQVTWSLRWGVARNNMMMAKMGIGTVPLILTPQMVQQPVLPAPSTLPSIGGQWLQDLIGEPQPLVGGCSLSAKEEEPCD